MANVVFFISVHPWSCGINYSCLCTPQIRQDVITNKRVLVLEELPHYIPELNTTPIKALEFIMKHTKIPVVYYAEEGTTRSGLHWVKIESSYNTGILKNFAPAVIYNNSFWNLEWTEDTPAGTIVYRASTDPIFDEFTTVNTVFLSTLKGLVKQGKSSVKEDEHEWIFTINDEEIINILRKHNLINDDNTIIKQKVKRKDHNVILLPL